MKTSLFKRIVAVFLTLVMAVYLWPAAAYAQIFNGTTQATNVTNISDAQLRDLISNISSGDIKNKKILSKNQLSPFVDYETAYAKGHVERLENLESLNTIVYLNKNGTKTVHFFENDVKFMDANGNIVDKDINLELSNDGFTTKRNDISLTLPNQISDGFTVSYNGKMLTLMPAPEKATHLTVNQTAILDSNDNTVTYESVFDTDSDLVYTPTLNGVKEEIVLSSYNGTNSWSYFAQTNGMYPFVGDDGIYYFAESENAEDKFSLGQVFVYDSACNIDGGTMQITPIRDGECYMVTLTVSKDFLCDPNTVYPIYVDPQVEINNASSTSNIIDTTVYSVKNTTNTGTWTLNHAGLYSTSYGVGRILVKLPGLTSSSQYISSSASDILNVTFYIYEATGKGGQEISLHAFTGSNWTETGATWNNCNPNSYEETPIATATPASRAYGAFDITSLVRAWKNGTKNADYGFILKNTNETDGTLCRAFIGGNHATTAQRPKLTVTYRDETLTAVSDDMGISDTYTYDVANLDNNVTNHTSHANGNLVSVNTLNIKTKDFPLAIEYVYNSKLYNDSSSNGNFYAYHGISTSYNMGKGWKLSLLELMKYDSSNYRYVYVDNYGTEYSFEQNELGVYVNAALEAELEIDSANNTVTLVCGDITRVFNANGLVSSVIYDDKTYTYNYTGTYALTSVTCDNSTILSLTYTSNKLTDIGNYTVTYDSSANVTGISDSYSNMYVYQTTSTSFAVRRSIDGYAYVYTFNADKKVNIIKYCHYQNSTYNIIEEKRPTYGTRHTVYCEPGEDFDFSTVDDNIYTTIVFDSDGRTMYSVVREKDGNKLHDVTMYPISENEGGNKLSTAVSGGGRENLLDNSSFETTTGVTGLTQTTEEKLLGSYSAKLSSAGTVSLTAPLSVGKYTFSAYVKLKNVTSTSGGACVEVYNASNTLVEQSEYYVGTSLENIGDGWYRIFVTFDAESAQTYKFNVALKNATGTVYADCVQLEMGSAPTEYNAVSFSGGEAASGTNTWSSATDITLTSDTATDGNYSWKLAAGKSVYREIPVNMPITARFIISGWGKTASTVSAGYGMDVILKYSDSTEETVQIRNDGTYAGWQYYCYEISSSKDDKSLKITSVKLLLTNGTTVPAYFENIFMSMAFDNSVSDTNDTSSDDETYSTGLSFISNGDGTCFIGERKNCTDTVIKIPPTSPSGDTVISIGNSAFKNYTDITEFVLPDTITRIAESAFWGCKGLTKINIPESVTVISKWAFVSCSALTDITLPSEVTSIGYKAFSYCTSLKALNIPKTVTSFGDYAFNGSTGLTLYYEGTSEEYAAITKGTGAVPSGVSVTYNSNILGDIAYIYTYDANDNVTSTTMKYVGSDTTLANGSDVLQTSSTYDADGNCLTYTDEAGNTTTYTYDSHGNVLTVKDANGITTTYTYNSNGLVATMTRQAAKNTYTYTNGLLTKIVHSDTSTSKSETYNIVYNVYGNISSIAVGTQTLITYEYQNNGVGSLTKTTYGNADYETYTYDVWGNMIEQHSGTTLKYEYTYDVNGNSVTVTDYESGRTKKQIYAANGEFVGTAVVDDQTKTILMLTEEDTYKIGTETFDFDGEYDYVYDALGRTSSESLKNGDIEIISKSFDYVDKTNSTNLIGSESFSNGSEFSYEYDALNRLTTVKENGTIKLKYTYDSMGRLTREDNAYANKSYVYEYATNGNISAKKTYAYTTGTLGTLQSTETRAYGNTNWLDQLTNIDGTAVNYDDMGNPLNWHNAENLTWSGRKLKSLTKSDGTVITYTYDENGIRTGKKVGNTTVEYITDGTKLVREKRDSYELTFLYDDSDNLIGFNYDNGTTSADYYYGIDNFGNINYIYDNTGAIVTTYKYDAWGKAISTTGTLALTIGTINPYRYKSYYYDTETELYYLQSRYYDAGVGRFVSADDIQFILTNNGIYTYNLYIYCDNDPLNHTDKIGLFPVHIIAGVVLGIAWSVIPRIIGDIVRGNISKISDYICDAISGAISGLVTSLTANSTLGSILGTFTGETVKFLIENGPKLKLSNFKSIIVEFLPVVAKAVLSGITSAIAGKLVKIITNKNFSSAQIRNYFKNTKYLKSAFGIGRGGKTARRMWFLDAGITTVLYNLLSI